MMKSCVIFIVVLFVCNSQQNRFDSIVDRVIAEIDKTFVKNDQSFVKLPKFRIELNASCSLEASDGLVGDLTTLYRVGDAIASQNSTKKSITVQVTLALNNLSLRFDQFQLKTSTIDISDTFEVSIRQNAASYRFVFIFNQDVDDPSCTTDFTLTNIDMFSEFDVTWGSGDAGNNRAEIIEIVMDHVSTDVWNAISSQIFAVVKNAYCQFVN